MQRRTRVSSKPDHDIRKTFLFSLPFTPLSEMGNALHAADAADAMPTKDGVAQQCEVAADTEVAVVAAAVPARGARRIHPRGFHRERLAEGGRAGAVLLLLARAT